MIMLDIRMVNCKVPKQLKGIEGRGMEGGGREGGGRREGRKEGGKERGRETGRERGEEVERWREGGDGGRRKEEEGGTVWLHVSSFLTCLVDSSWRSSF